MIIDSFIEKLAAEFDELEAGTLKPRTSFKHLEDWGSMQALIVIALIETEYDVTITGNDLRNIETIQEIFDLVKERIK